MSYKYYDSPEGHDIYKKLIVTSKYAAIAGIGAGTLDVLMYSHPQGIGATIGRYIYHVGPLVGMAAAFTATANLGVHLRGKNDSINYFFGGAAAGGVFGAWQKSIMKGFVGAMILGAVGVTKKSGIDNNWIFFPEPKHMVKTATTANLDWSLVEELPKNYKTE